jgi:NADH-quinone oxidoreductase subunit N
VTASLREFVPAVPEIFLLAATCVLLIADLYVKSERRLMSYVIAQLILLGCALLTSAVSLLSVGRPVVSFGGLFVGDQMGNLLKLVAYLSVAMTLAYSREYLIDRQLLKGEFLALLLFALLGIMVLISASSFITLYLGLELLSLCQYAMIALNRDSPASVEAAMKYFVLGALASGLLLYGMSMIYGATGTLTLPDVARHVAEVSGSAAQRPFLVFGLVFIVAGIAFKLGLVPFHMWIPDVYQGAPTAITMVIGSAPKLAAFAMAIRLLVNGLPELAVDWQQMLVILAVLSMVVGNVTAIAQTNIKRMLAYSTIAHMGFMLLGLLSGVVGGSSQNATVAYAAALYYTIVYVLMVLGAFGVLLLLSRAGFECERLDDMKGLNRRSPWYAFVMLVLMFSLAGIPPTAGFYAKLAVFSAAVNAGLVWLAVVGVLLALIGAFYYLRVVKLMYFDDPVDAAPVTGSGEIRLVLSANGLALLALGILPQTLMALCFSAIRGL